VKNEDLVYFEEALRNGFEENGFKDVLLRYLGDFSTDISVVLKYRAIAHGKELVVFSKWEKNEKGLLKIEYDNIRRFENISQRCKKYLIPNVCFYSEKRRLLVLEECKGNLVYEGLAKGCSWFSKKHSERSYECSKRLGEWLKFYEDQSVEKLPSVALKSEIMDELARYEKAVLSMSRASIVVKTFMSIKKRLEEKMDDLTDEELVYFSHGDFHSANFFMTEKTVTAIDFQHSKKRLLGYDAVYFSFNMFLSMNILKFNPCRKKQIIRSLYDSYGRKNNKLNDDVNKALVAVRGLVYLTTVRSRGGLVGKISFYLDLVKVRVWR